MPIEETPHHGWDRNLRLANNYAELILTLEVGPRIISYRPLDGVNIFKTYPEQLGMSGESDWKIRGGHRHWIAPEDEILSYIPDNTPFSYSLKGENSVSTSVAGIAPWHLRKDTTITLHPENCGVTVEHTIINESQETWKIAPWALTVMAPGGISILPQPPLGEHPRDLLPNRAMILWPYTDLTDPRLRLGRHFFTLEQRGDCQPLKLGLAHREGWAAYLLGNQLFVKTVPWLDGVEYPDFGCNYETFTNHEMLEIETLGALSTLEPGKAASHSEEWRIFSGLTPPPVTDSPDFAEWLRPYLPIQS